MKMRRDARGFGLEQGKEARGERNSVPSVSDHPVSLPLHLKATRTPCHWLTTRAHVRGDVHADSLCPFPARWPGFIFSLCVCACAPACVSSLEFSPTVSNL